MLSAGADTMTCTEGAAAATAQVARAGPACTSTPSTVGFASVSSVLASHSSAFASQAALKRCNGVRWHAGVWWQ